MMHVLYAVMVLVVASATARAANVPERFNGMWVDAGAPNKELCQRAEPKGEDNRPVESMMSVGPEGVTYYEQHCKIASVKVLPGPNPQGDERNNLEVGLSCRARACCGRRARSGTRKRLTERRCWS